jgi:hypothetical protein
MAISPCSLFYASYIEVAPFGFGEHRCLHVRQIFMICHRIPCCKSWSSAIPLAVSSAVSERQSALHPATAQGGLGTTVTNVRLEVKLHLAFTTGMDAYLLDRWLSVG